MSRRGENIYKRKDNRWEGRYIKERSSDNKPKYGYVYAHSYKEVKDKLLNAKLSLNNEISKNLSNKNILFKLLAEEWLESIQPQIKESTNIKYYNLLYSYILPDLGEYQIEEITNENLEKLCNKLLTNGGKNQKGLSSKTVADVFSLIRNIFKFALQKGILISCDADSIKVKQTIRKMRIFTNIEQEKLYQYLCLNLNSYNLGILMCLFTGIRIGEVCALRWEDISISEKNVYIHQTMQRIQTPNKAEKTKVIISPPKSNCSIRTIPLPDCLIDIMVKFDFEKKGYFLTGRNDKFIEPRTMQNHFKKILKQNSIADTNFHSLRHTFATRCVELGFDIKSLSEILGHASVNITMNRYVHPSMELKRENMQRLSNLIVVK